MALPFEITPQELRSKLETGERVYLLDVREHFEYQICRIGDARFVPMGAVPASLPELERAGDDGLLVAYCHHGVRSLSVIAWLRNQGLENCQSLSGGIDRWSTEVDPAVPRY